MASQGWELMVAAEVDWRLRRDHVLLFVLYAVILFEAWVNRGSLIGSRIHLLKVSEWFFASESDSLLKRRLAVIYNLCCYIFFLCVFDQNLILKFELKTQNRRSKRDKQTKYCFQ